MALGGIGAPAHDLRRGHAGGGEVHLVLHGGEEDLGFLLAFPVVGGQGEDLADALIHALLAGPDLADAGQQFVEVVGQPVAALQPLVVQREALDDVLAEALRRPLAELRATEAVDPVADRDDGSRGCRTKSLADSRLPVPANCKGFLYSCLRPQFALRVDVLEVHG